MEVPCRRLLPLSKVIVMVLVVNLVHLPEHVIVMLGIKAHVIVAHHWPTLIAKLILLVHLVPLIGHELWLLPLLVHPTSIVLHSIQVLVLLELPLMANWHDHLIACMVDHIVLDEVVVHVLVSMPDI